MPTSALCKQITVDICIFVFFMCLPILALFIWGQPATNGFWCNDQSLSFPYKPDTVSQNLLLLVGFGAPFFVMTVTEFLRAALRTKVPRRFKRELFCLAKAYGVFLFGLATNVIFTDTIKYSVGRLRPHFFDLCKPDFGKINCTDNIARYVSEFECTNTEVDHHLLRDGRLSFPSGHASLSMYSALFTVFYLQLRMKVSFSYLLRPVIQVFLVVAALLCCLTRITDHKHFLTDVLAGTILGVTVAWLTFYKLGHKLIPNTEPQQPPPPSHIRRATSIESEPQTPTPLLRPERLVLSHNHLQNNGFRNGTGQATLKDQFGNV